MTHIHFLKEGTGEGHARRVHSLPVLDASEKLAQYAVRFYEVGPRLGGESPVSAVAPYRAVVLEVETGETSPKFPKAGYYQIVGLSPSDCAGLFGIYF